MSGASSARTVGQPSLPNNLEIEQSVLGSLMAHPDAWTMVAPILQPEHLFEPLHERIFEAITMLKADGQAVSPLTLKSHFERDATINEIGGWQYLVRLTGAAGPMISLQSHARLLRQLADRRALMTVCHQTEECAAAVGGHGDFRQMMSEHISLVTNLFDGARERKTTYSLAEASKETVARLRRLRSGEADPTAIPTGIPALDAMTGGLRRGEYVVLGARPSMGKTALAVQLAVNIAETRRGVAYFSLEMPTMLLTPRFLASKLWTPGGSVIAYDKMLRGELNDTQMRWAESASEEMASWPLVIEDEPALTSAEIEARARVIAARFKSKAIRLDLVVVDHIHKCRHPGAQSKVSEYTEISAGLAEAAKRLDLPIVALAQLNRAVESRDEKRPSLADLRESGAIEQDADAVAFLYREAYYLERTRCRTADAEADRLAELARCAHSLELIIAKQRSGPIGTIHLWADMPANVIRDMSEVTP